MNIEKAGLIRRAIALYIDSFIVTILFFAPMYNSIMQISTSLDFGNAFSKSIDYSIIGLVIMALRDCYKGISPGKWMVGIRVVDIESGENPNVLNTIIRNLFIVVWPIELFTLLFSKDRRRIGDRLANTIVIRDRNKFSLKRILIIFLIVITMVSSFAVIMGSLFKSDKSYQAAIEYIEKNEDILNTTNGIKGYGFIPTGSIEITNGYGQADLSISVKGNTKDVKVYIYLEKEPGNDWIVKDFKFDPE